MSPGLSASPSPPPTSQATTRTIPRIAIHESRPNSEELKGSASASIRSFGSISFREHKKDEKDTESTRMRGQPKPSRPSRLREASPPPARRFQSHVSFDNFGGGDATEHNTIAFTLNVRHNGYHHQRGSRTFMVGVDEHLYSDYALQWMLDELVDDGDEIVCVRVIEKDAKISGEKSLESKQYQEEARKLMQTIQSKNDENRAISIVLEFAVGKLHTTFQKLIQIYEPGMLVVGTRGRSLGGFQGLVGNRNSFSKWCLQYSPIPVVVVRPTEKREKKKLKRTNDPSRQNYLQILLSSGNELHETEYSGANSPKVNPLLTKDSDAEAHAVAAALALPARFDPTLKPLADEQLLPLRKIPSGKSDATDTTFEPDSRPSSPEALRKSSLQDDPESPAGSGGEESDDGEFEVFSGQAALGLPVAEDKKEKLHKMEVGEGAALAARRKSSTASTSSSGSAHDSGSGSGSGSGNDAAPAGE